MYKILDGIPLPARKPSDRLVHPLETALKSMQVGQAIEVNDNEGKNFHRFVKNTDLKFTTSRLGKDKVMIWRIK